MWLLIVQTFNTPLGDNGAVIGVHHGGVRPRFSRFRTLRVYHCGLQVMYTSIRTRTAVKEFRRSDVSGAKTKSRLQMVMVENESGTSILKFRRMIIPVT